MLKTLKGEIKKRFRKSLRDALGPPAEEIITVNEEKNETDRARIAELKNEKERPDIGSRERETISDQISLLDERIIERERVNEIIQERLSVRDRIKAIFKKHGFTAISVLTAAGVVIGVIVSHLKTGLSNLAKGVGNGLKDIGKKVGNILPGMIGAIASFIFRTAGEVVGFLAKNAWLLI